MNDKRSPRVTHPVTAPKNQGEGDREAARRFNEDQQQFVKAGKSDGAARRAAPESPQRAAELERAVQKGLSHAKGEDPTVPGANAAKRPQGPRR
jgi:hypothetical protein